MFASMRTRDFIRKRYGPLQRYLWDLLKDNEVMTIDEFVEATPVGHQCMGGEHHRRRLSTALWRMAKNGDIYKVGRAQYAVRRSAHKKKFTMAEQLLHYLRQRGKVHFKQIAAAFRPKTDASVRSGLMRLRAEVKADNDGMEWYPIDNIVDLKQRLAGKKPEPDAVPTYPPGEQRWKLQTPQGETVLRVQEGVVVGVDGPLQWLQGHHWSDVKSFCEHQGWAYSSEVDGEIASR